jgi:hypothetical protein
MSTGNWANRVPGWLPFCTNFLVFSSQVNWQLTFLSHRPAYSRHFTQLNCWQHSAAARLVSLFYNLGADPTENTASRNPSIVVMDGCLAIDWISFPRESVCRPLLRNGRLSAYCIITAVLVVRIQVSAQQRVYTPQYRRDKMTVVLDHSFRWRWALIYFVRFTEGTHQTGARLRIQFGDVNTPYTVFSQLISSKLLPIAPWGFGDILKIIILLIFVLDSLAYSHQN